MTVFGLIAANPMMARERNEFDPPIRIQVHQQHVIPYLVDASGVLVIRVFGAGQDWRALLAALE